MHWTRAHVAHDEIGQLLLPPAQPSHEAVPEPAPEEGDPGDLEPPPAVTSTGERLLDEEPIRVGVQVEAREGEDGVAATDDERRVSVDRRLDEAKARLTMSDVDA